MADSLRKVLLDVPVHILLLGCPKHLDPNYKRYLDMGKQIKQLLDRSISNDFASQQVKKLSNYSET